MSKKKNEVKKSDAIIAPKNESLRLELTIRKWREDLIEDKVYEFSDEDIHFRIASGVCIHVLIEVGEGAKFKNEYPHHKGALVIPPEGLIIKV